MKTKIDADPAKLEAFADHLAAAVADDGLSRHAALRSALLAAIHAGHWSAGERLPTESELALASGFSYGTVQRALRTLTDEGVVRRRQGSGSFVADGHHRIDDVTHCRFLADDGASILPVYSTVLSRRRWRASGPWNAYFDASRERVVRLDRVLSINGEFDVFSRFFFDGLRFADLASRPIAALAGTNFDMLLRRELNAPAGELSQSLQVVGAPDEVAPRIGVRIGDAVALLEAARHVAGTGVLYFQQVFVPPTHRKLVTLPAR